MATTWAEDMAKQVAEAESDCNPSLAAMLRAKQHLYLTYALACYGTFGDVDAADAANMVQLRMMMHATEPLLEGGAASQLQRTGCPPCASLVQRAMASHLPAILGLLEHDATALTAAAISVLPTLPRALPWTPGNLKDSSPPLPLACFESILPDGKSTVHINIYNGVVLYNGLPPHHLPVSIVSHPLYKRVFGERNCNVVMQADGSLKTARPLAGRFYSFGLNAATNHLTVKEYEPLAGDARADAAAAEVVYTLLDSSSQSENDHATRIDRSPRAAVAGRRAHRSGEADGAGFGRYLQQV